MYLIVFIPTLMGLIFYVSTIHFESLEYIQREDTRNF